MKKLLLFLVFALVCASASGQGRIGRVRDSLATRSMPRQARVVVTESGDAARAVRRADGDTVRVKIVRYGVSLFRANGQDAGENARAVITRFAEMYPDIPVSLEYASPWFTVSAGNFVDRTDAIALCGKVQQQFPMAVVRQKDAIQ